MRGGAPARRDAAPESPEVRSAKPLARGKPFGRGKANYSSRFNTRKRASLQGWRATDKRRWLEKVASGPFLALQLSPRSKSEPLSARERARLEAARKTPSPARSPGAGTRKLTQQDAAAAAGVHYSTVCRGEKRAREAAAEQTTPRTLAKRRKLLRGRPRKYSDVDTPKDPGALRPEDLLLCDRAGCPGVYHWQCLRLRAAPARSVTWFCPTCARGGQPLVLRKWSKAKLAQAGGDGAAFENLLAGADASTGDASSDGEELSCSSDDEEPASPPASPPAPAAPVRAGRGANRRK